MPVAAQAYLGNNEFLVIPEYQVDFTHPAPVIPFHKLKSAGAQTIERNILRGPTFVRRAAHSFYCPLLKLSARMARDGITTARPRSTRAHVSWR